MRDVLLILLGVCIGVALDLIVLWVRSPHRRPWRRTIKPALPASNRQQTALNGTPVVPINGAAVVTRARVRSRAPHRS